MIMPLKPPQRCPCCGDPAAEVVKRWERRVLPTGKVLRYPVALGATYHCGARIEARFVVRDSFTGHLGGAHWRFEVLAGCRQSLGDALARLPIER